MRVLVTPLDWGLGHATRVCPLIDYLRQKHEVIIAASGRGYAFLSRRYPDLLVLRVPALRLRYMRSRALFDLGLVWIGVKLMVNYVIDRLWIGFITRHYAIDLIVSDNRFGMYSTGRKSYFIAHQLYPIFPGRMRFLEKLGMGVYHRLIRKYDVCLVPDYPGEERRLAGQLSRPLPGMEVQYLGLLSRFYDVECHEKGGYDVVAMVSGIEPHRRLLIQKIINQLKDSQYRVLVVGGRPDRFFDQKIKNIRIVSHLDDRELCAYLLGAKVIIARAGYSTIMDLLTIGRSAIIIPTPGQTEQEYIAQWLNEKGLFYAVDQDRMELLAMIKRFEGRKQAMEKTAREVMARRAYFKKILEETGL